MWYNQYLLHTLTMFLPPMAQIITLEKPFLRPAVGMLDIDGDGVLELIGIYNWQRVNYIIVLKYFWGAWYIADIIKGKRNNVTYFGSIPITNSNRNNLVVGWQLGEMWLDFDVYQWTDTGLTCEYKPFSDQSGIDFSSIKYICSETRKDARLEKALITVFDLDQFEANVRYYYNKVDLNGDGVPEIFAYVVGSPVCGSGGCSAAIFKQLNGEYVLLSKFTLVNNPVVISNTKTNGFRDIIMYVSGGGIESFFAWVKYDGTGYPVNPSIQPKVEPGTKIDGVAIIADDITKNPGIEL